MRGHRARHAAGRSRSGQIPAAAFQRLERIVMFSYLLQWTARRGSRSAVQYRWSLALFRWGRWQLA